jgi:hypothetical protein
MGTGLGIEAGSEEEPGRSGVFTQFITSPVARQNLPFGLNRQNLPFGDTSPYLLPQILRPDLPEVRPIEVRVAALMA